MPLPGTSPLWNKSSLSPCPPVPEPPSWLVLPHQLLPEFSAAEPRTGIKILYLQEDWKFALGEILPANGNILKAPFSRASMETHLMLSLKTKSDGFHITLLTESHHFYTRYLLLFNNKFFIPHLSTSCSCTETLFYIFLKFSFSNPQSMWWLSSSW